jgi:hypothetical protein
LWPEKLRYFQSEVMFCYIRFLDPSVNSSIHPFFI